MAVHPEREAFEEFFRGELSEEEAEAITEHLETDRCMACLFVAREAMAEAEPSVQDNLRGMVYPNEYERAPKEGRFERAMTQSMRWGKVIDVERALAPELLAELERRGPAAARDAIRTHERYKLYGLSEHANERSRELAFENVALALETAELAVEVADALDPRIYMGIVVADERALARACLGNARRLASDLFGAERAFQESLPIAKKGTRSSVARSDLQSLLGSLRIDQGRYLEAREALETALKACRVHKSKRDEGKILIKLANSYGYAGEPERAVEVLEEAIPVLEEAGDEQLVMWSQHNLTDWMVDADQAMEALARYEKARELYDEHCTEPPLRLRRRWLEGRIYAGLGELDLAREALEEVRRTAAERELSYELAMVSLELALVYMRRRESARVQDLAEEMTLIFRSHDLHRHALGAMYLFRQAARTDTATAGLVREIFEYLRRARNNPFLRFEPAARWG